MHDRHIPPWRARAASWVPLGLGAAILALAGLLLMLNMALFAAHLGTMKLVPGLTGVTLPQKARFSARALLDGTFQAETARVIGIRMPFYPAAVRLRNQVEYALFNVAAVPALLLGHDDILMEAAYVQDWCTRDIAAWRPGAVSWAADIRRMQDWYERSGRVFVYTLTPSKVAQYPDIVPPAYVCPSTPADRTGLVPAWLDILRDAGVHVADAVTPVLSAHKDFPFRLFPPGGTHWSTVGGAIGEQALFTQLDAQRPGQGFAPYRITWHMNPKPSDRDHDLALLMNLLIPIDDGPVAVADVQFPPAPSCPDRRIVIVGGSFSHSALDLLKAAPCHDVATEYEYWHVMHLVWGSKGKPDIEAVNEAARDAAVRDADILIYEENEELLRAPSHGKALFQFLQSQPSFTLK